MVRFKIQNFSHPFPKSSIEKVAGINGSLWSYPDKIPRANNNLDH